MRIATYIATLPMMTSLAFAQQPGQQTADDQAIPALMFFTLFAALAIGVGGLMWFLRKRSNRDAMKGSTDDQRPMH
ncbi:MAG: hypothetical protein B7Y80_19425 [Hyphomicrobium sp. 32-62-53]|nr:MAG: hypothetical protein B7Z29_16825 [Hyphomicrobium sp. 12-62-95]OYX97501.1 MAG: hypothetical protein B7Y80_19425 [Hyphomicrobium sp. 32-62-53]